MGLIGRNNDFIGQILEIFGSEKEEQKEKGFGKTDCG